MVPLVLYEVANDPSHILPQDLAIRENTVNRISDLAQAFSPFLVFTSEITDLSQPQRDREISAWRRPNLPGDGGTP
jgi:hypothetical protein